MIRKIKRRNRRKNIWLSRKFAAALIGIGYGLVFAEFAWICLLGPKMALIGGSIFGYMIYNFYLGICQDLIEERERRRTWEIGGRKESAVHASSKSGAQKATEGSRVRIMYR